MTETYTPAALAALEGAPYHEEAFVKIVFPSYTLRCCSLLRPYTLDGETYDGVGTVGSISVISESADVSADPITLTLSGLQPSLVSALQDFAHQGSLVTIKIAQFDASGVLIPDPITPFVGTVDTMSWALGNTMSVSVQADSYLRLLFRGPDGHRRMAADQEAIFPSDFGLGFAASLVDNMPWGVPTGSGVEAGPPPSGLGKLRYYAGRV